MIKSFRIIIISLYCIQVTQIFSNLGDWFPFHSHLKLDDSINLGLTHFFKNSNTTVDYGTVIQDWYDDGMHINFEIRRDGIYANKIDKDGNSISQRTICTF